MQDYRELLPTGLISVDRATINDNIKSVASNFSGNVFPVNNLTEGMLCYRTDQSKLYILLPDLITWKLLVDWSSGEVYTANSTHSVNANNAENDANGSKITDYIKKITAVESTITIIKGDGTSTTITTPNTTYKAFKGATQSQGGSLGLVPQAAAGRQNWLLAGDGTWHDLGSGNIGSNIVPVYMNGGKLAASTATVGSNKKPVYLSQGSITATNGNIGNEAKPIFMKNGEFTECASGTGLMPSVTLAGSKQEYRSVDASNPNKVDASGGSGNVSRYYLRTNTGWAGGLTSLQEILQELVNKSHSHDIYRQYYNCNCNCNCDCGDDCGN